MHDVKFLFRILEHCGKGFHNSNLDVVEIL